MNRKRVCDENGESIPTTKKGKCKSKKACMSINRKYTDTDNIATYEAAYQSGDPYQKGDER